MVAVVGRLFQKWFPAQPNLSYTFIWDKTDAYNQKVYGLSEAVGEYCGAGQSTRYELKGNLKHVRLHIHPLQHQPDINVCSRFCGEKMEGDKCFK